MTLTSTPTRRPPLTTRAVNAPTTAQLRSIMDLCARLKLYPQTLDIKTAAQAAAAIEELTGRISAAEVIKTPAPAPDPRRLEAMQGSVEEEAPAAVVKKSIYTEFQLRDPAFEDVNPYPFLWGHFEVRAKQKAVADALANLEKRRHQ